MDYHKAAETLLGARAALRWFAGGSPAEQLAYGESLALLLLLRHGAPVHPRELSREMDVSTARVAAVLKHLESRGLLHRSPDDRDSRQVQVTLTEAGRQEILARHAAVTGSFAAMLEALGPEDTEALLRIARKLEALCPPPPDRKEARHE